MRIVSKGQATLPKDIRGRVGTRPGIEVEFYNGRLVLWNREPDETDARRRSRHAPDTHP